MKPLERLKPTDIEGMDKQSLTAIRDGYLETIGELGQKAVYGMPEHEVSAGVAQIGVCYENVRLCQDAIEKLS